jgi:hypothetical protein
MYAEKEEGMVTGGVNRIDQMNAYAVKTSPEKIGPIGQAMQVLAEEINCAEAQMERLADKLRPVRMESPAKTGEACGIHGSCELADRINLMACRVRSLNSHIAAIREEVCL